MEFTQVVVFISLGMAAVGLGGLGLSLGYLAKTHSDLWQRYHNRDSEHQRSLVSAAKAEARLEESREELRRTKVRMLELESGG